MFVQHKQLKALNVPVGKISRLRTSGSCVQLAFPGFTPQPASAYLIALSDRNKVMVLVGFFLSEAKQSIFFVPDRGEVSVEEAEEVFDEGFVFAESMGFVLGETDFHLLSVKDQEKLWSTLPIGKLVSIQTAPENKSATAQVDKKAPGGDELEAYRQRSLKSLGRFLASL